jgi:hypothetical protein
MTAARQALAELLTGRAPADEPPVDEVGTTLVGFNWEFSDAERERYGEAIMTAIAEDEATPPAERGTRAGSR